MESNQNEHIGNQSELEQEDNGNTDADAEQETAGPSMGAEELGPLGSLGGEK